LLVYCHFSLRFAWMFEVRYILRSALIAGLPAGYCYLYWAARVPTEGKRANNK